MAKEITASLCAPSALSVWCSQPTKPSHLHLLLCSRLGQSNPEIQELVRSAQLSQEVLMPTEKCQSAPTSLNGHCSCANCTPIYYIMQHHGLPEPPWAGHLCVF